MLHAQILMPALEIDQPTINTDFNTVDSQLIELNQVKDNRIDTNTQWSSQYMCYPFQKKSSQYEI